MIKNTSTVDKNTLINEVLNNHLYVDKEGFLLKYILEDYQNHPYYATGVRISLYYDNGFPIALAFMILLNTIPSKYLLKKNIEIKELLKS